MIPKISRNFCKVGSECSRNFFRAINGQLFGGSIACSFVKTIAENMAASRSKWLAYNQRYCLNPFRVHQKPAKKDLQVASDHELEAIASIKPGSNKREWSCAQTAGRSWQDLYHSRKNHQKYLLNLKMPRPKMWKLKKFNIKYSFQDSIYLLNSLKSPQLTKGNFKGQELIMGIRKYRR